MSNFVQLAGHPGNRVCQKELPSGNIATMFAAVADRSRSDQVGKMNDCTLPCETFSASVVQRVPRLKPGTKLMCNGLLRRRFYKTAGGLGSAFEVEV